MVMSELSELLVLAAIGAIVGFVFVKIAPRHAQQYSTWCQSDRSLPLHLLSTIFFGSAYVVAISQGDLFQMCIGAAMTLTGVLASYLIWRKRCAVAGFTR